MGAPSTVESIADSQADLGGLWVELARTSLDSDMVFGEDSSLQVAAVTGTVDDDLTASLSFTI